MRQLLNITIGLAMTTMLAATLQAQTVRGEVAIPSAYASLVNKPQEVAIDETTGAAYVTQSYDNYAPGEVVKIDPETATIVQRIPVGYGPWYIVRDSVRDRFYVGHQNLGGIAVIQDDRVVETLYPGWRTTGIGFNPNTQKLYVSLEASSMLAVIDTGTGSLEGMFDVGNYRSMGLAVDPRTNYVYVSGSDLVVFDGATNSVIKRLLGVSTAHLAIDHVNGRLYGADGAGRSIVVIELATNEVVSRIDVPAPPDEGPIGVGYNAATNRLFVSRPSQMVTVFDASSFEPVQSLAAGNFGIAVDAVRNRVVVASRCCVFMEEPGVAGLYIIDDPAASAKLWLGLRNSDDQGTSFDLRAALYINGSLVDEGQTLCVAGITRNASKPKAVTVHLGGELIEQPAAGDIISFKLFARIGTRSDGSKCPGHNSAVGVRLYYGAPSRPSGFDVSLAFDPLAGFFLARAGSALVLEATPPQTATVEQKDSSSLSFSGGNRWVEIGTWTRQLP